MDSYSQHKNAEYTRAGRQGRHTENARHMHAAPADIPAGRLSWESSFLFLLEGLRRSVTSMCSECDEDGKQGLHLGVVCLVARPGQGLREPG